MSKSKAGTPPAMPTKLLRLVLQLEDTTLNRVMIENAYELLTRAAQPLTGHGVIKLEEIHIVCAAIPRHKFASSPKLPSP